MRNQITFALPNDRMIVFAYRPDQQTPNWRIAFEESTGGAVLGEADVIRTLDGDGEVAFNSDFAPELGDRRKRLVQAAVYLGATIAASPDHLIHVESKDADDTAPEELQPTLYADLKSLGLSDGETYKSDLRPHSLYAQAGVIRRAFGSQYERDFSLSPAETDY